MKSFFFSILLTLVFALPSHSAGIPVIDASNLSQNAVSAFEAVTQTIKQIEEYVLQLQQYEDQIKNSLAPAAYVWSKAQQTMNKILELQNQFNYYMNAAGNMDNYLKKFGNVNTYRDSPYFGVNGGTDEQREALLESETAGSEAQKHTSDNMLRTLDQQQKSLKEDADTLEDLQRNVSTAQGRMEAIQYANQLAAHQNSQLLQLRALIMSQQAAEAARAQTVMAREARRQAGSEKAVESRYTKSQDKNWLDYLVR